MLQNVPVNRFQFRNDKFNFLQKLKGIGETLGISTRMTKLTIWSASTTPRRHKCQRGLASIGLLDRQELSEIS